MANRGNSKFGWIRRFLALNASPGLEQNSPYPLDFSEKPLASSDWARLQKSTIFFDGVFKGDYSLAIVNRYLARALLQAGLDLRLYTSDAGWESDAMLNEMLDIHSRFIRHYPKPDSFDIHLRNTWPPKADDMIGLCLNAYVCFAWEESAFPREFVDHFNDHLGLVTVTSNFVQDSLTRSGVSVPIAIVGDGTDHIDDFPQAPLPAKLQRSERDRVLHVSSCFPRKASDRLVEAFVDTFSKEDSVELVIKTFDNPHSTIEEVVAHAREARPSAPPIQIVKESMPYPQLIELIRTSDLMVAPSRGEGFGLPLAEALLLSVPVVTTAYSGQTDFCTEETAWLVDFRLTPSEAHVSAPEATWADPNLDSLGRQMRHALEKRKESRRKVEKGQKLLRKYFKWSDVARRTAQAITAVSSSAESIEVAASEESKAMSIDLVSTWSQMCGIATYSEHLFSTSALSPTLSKVFAREFRQGERSEFGHKQMLSSVRVSRPWGYDSAGIKRLAAEIAAGRSDILWLQHHPGFFSNRDMIEIAEAIDRSQYSLKVITLHNVVETLENNNVSWLSRFDAVLAHTKSDRDLLLQRKIKNARAMPHGILSPYAGRSIREPTYTIGTFGFLAPHKNIPLLVEAFSIALQVEPRLRLMILTCVKDEPSSLRERARVEATIDALRLSEFVHTDFRFLSDEEILEQLNQCAFLCFPYGHSDESASGALRLALAADRPLVCAESRVLAEVEPFSLVLTSLSAQALAEAFVVLSAFPELAEVRTAERRRFVAEHGYHLIAERSLSLLRHLLKGKGTDA